MLEELAKQSGELVLQTNEKMLFNYENQHSVYIIVSGKLSFVLENHITGKQAIDEFEAGSLVGHFNARLSVKGDVSLVATKPTVLLFIGNKTLTPLLDQSPGAQFQFDKTIRNIIHRGQFATYMSRLFGLHDPTGLKELDREGIANEPSTSIRNTDISQWLHKKEAAYENVILIADGPWSNWSERAIRQADHLLLVADFDSDVKQSEQEKKINALWDFSSHLKQSLILIHPADTTDISGTKLWLDERRIISFYHVRKEQSEDYARLARILTGQANSLVLGGGGARGYAHIGVIRALEENGVTIDTVGGTSIGGIIAAAVALQYDSNRIYNLCSQYFRRFFDFTLPIISLIKGKKIEKTLKAPLVTRGLKIYLFLFSVSPQT
ncbi:MAG: patatin-like phospholipase family protein [Porticoccaceae bacterium]|nr:patatin-like phospholipase family protein [Porticoccaceae bacterium]